MFSFGELESQAVGNKGKQQERRLVSRPRCSSARVSPYRAIPQSGCMPAEPASVSPDLVVNPKLKTLSMQSIHGAHMD